MVGTHLEDRMFDAVHDVEVAALDTGREMTHTVYKTVPMLVTDFTKMTDATFDFAGRMLEIQLEALHKAFGRMRDTYVMPATTHRASSGPKGSTTRKVTTAKKAA